MARGGHGLPKLSTGPAMPDRSTPCGQANPETDSQPFQQRPAPMAGGLWPSPIPLETPCLTLKKTQPVDTFRSRSEKDSNG
jgi:hypothetical protein